MEPQDVDAIAARTQARELAWGRNESVDAVAVDVGGVRYILAADGATLFVVRPHLGGISRCEEGRPSLDRSVASSRPTSSLRTRQSG